MDEPISEDARTEARAIMKELGIQHSDGEQIIGEALEQWADKGYIEGARRKFDEMMQGFIGSHVMLLTSEGRSVEDAIRFVERGRCARNPPHRAGRHAQYGDEAR
jgi:hypothetical protein